MAIEAGTRLVATGRSDLPNQVNNSSIFPGLFRGVLNVRASSISDGMARAAAHALARGAKRAGLNQMSILPPTDDPMAAAEVAAAVGEQAQMEGVAALAAGRDELLNGAVQRILAAREANRLVATHDAAESESDPKPA